MRATVAFLVLTVPLWAQQAKPQPKAPTTQESAKAKPEIADQGDRVAITDWQKSLPLFVKHLEAARKEDAKSISIIDNALAIGIMSSLGGCVGEKPDTRFGPTVEFDAVFDKLKPLEPEKNNLRSKHGLDLSFDETTPGRVMHVYPAMTALAEWQAIEKGARVRFRAELNHLVYRFTKTYPLKNVCDTLGSWRASPSVRCWL